jgi:hypothetical protein
MTDDTKPTFASAVQSAQRCLQAAEAKPLNEGAEALVAVADAWMRLATVLNPR